VHVSTTLPTTVHIRREHLIVLVVAAAAMAAAITWLLVAVAFDAGATVTQPSVSQQAGSPVISSTQFPPNYRGLP
jgi:LPS O-antigen subunit length determinant protein (WzzB/FepE family)